MYLGNSLVLQGLGLCASNAEVMGLIPRELRPRILCSVAPKFFNKIIKYYILMHTHKYTHAQKYKQIMSICGNFHPCL